MDWAWLFYLGTNILGMTEAEFWKCTMRKLDSLYKIYFVINGDTEAKEKVEKGNIEDVLF
ncbi:MAG: hypothetical protein N4A63_08085 [Vallitalea sp.]|nr:hypothetical protein [Vallitalea sp.]